MSWDEFSGQRARLTDAIKGKTATVTIHEVRSANTKYGKKLIFRVKYGKEEYDWFVNATSTKVLREKIKEPEEAIGYTLTLEKMKVLIQGEAKEILVATKAYKEKQKSL